MARFLVSSVRGLRLTSRITPERDVLRQIVEVTLSTIE